MEKVRYIKLKGNDVLQLNDEYLDTYCGWTSFTNKKSLNLGKPIYTMYDIYGRVFRRIALKRKIGRKTLNSIRKIFAGLTEEIF